MKKRRLRIYVAGPYSADNVLTVFGNMRRGIEESARLFEGGVAPFCPWLDYQFALAARRIHTVEEYYDYSTAWLEASDALVVVGNRSGLPGPDTSRGTRAEVARARELGIPVFFSSAEFWATVERGDVPRREPMEPRGEEGGVA